MLCLFYTYCYILTMHVFTFIISILLNTCMCTFANHYSSTYHGNNSIKSFIYNKQIHQTRPSLNFFFHFLILILLGQQPIVRHTLCFPTLYFPINTCI